MRDTARQLFPHSDFSSSDFGSESLQKLGILYTKLRSSFKFCTVLIITFKYEN